VYGDLGLDEAHQCDASGSSADVQHTEPGVRDIAPVQQAHACPVPLGLQDVKNSALIA
jgi:hypothetical protein